MSESQPNRHFASWANVPPGTYLTKSQMGSLDFPRTPGPVAATVDGYDYRNKKTVVDLYRIDESTPTTASVKVLAAARRRSPGSDPHLCTDCGAHPDLPTTQYQDGPRLCRACAHIRSLRIHQQDSATRRAHTATRAAELLAGPLAVVHCALIHRGTTPSGTRRAPSAVHSVAVDQTGTTLFDTVVRLVGPSARGIPEGAVGADDAGQLIRGAFSGRTIVRWKGTGFADLADALHGAGWTDAIPTGYGACHDLMEMTLLWRGDHDPVTGRNLTPVPPGRADRMLYLLQQIAAGGEA